MAMYVYSTFVRQSATRLLRCWTVLSLDVRVSQNVHLQLSGSLELSSSRWWQIRDAPNVIGNALMTLRNEGRFFPSRAVRSSRTEERATPACSGRPCR